MHLFFIYIYFLMSHIQIGNALCAFCQWMYIIYRELNSRIPSTYHGTSNPRLYYYTELWLNPNPGNPVASFASAKFAYSCWHVKKQASRTEASVFLAPTVREKANGRQNVCLSSSQFMFMRTSNSRRVCAFGIFGAQLEPLLLWISAIIHWGKK